MFVYSAIFKATGDRYLMAGFWGMETYIHLTENTRNRFVVEKKLLLLLLHAWGIKFDVEIYSVIIVTTEPPYNVHRLKRDIVFDIDP